MAIRVTRINRTITVRLGATSARKVVASEKAATTTLSTLQQLENVQDINVDARADRTLLMFDASSQKYIHVDPAQVVDLADSTDDDAYDAGTF